jgi:hypothetical protein
MHIALLVNVSNCMNSLAHDITDLLITEGHVLLCPILHQMQQILGAIFKHNVQVLIFHRHLANLNNVGMILQIL